MNQPTSTISDPRIEIPVSGTHALGEPSEASSIPPTSSERWWRIGDFGVLGLWIGIVSFTLSYHEKWLDEAQAWLFARDLNLRTLWFYELRYEGSPGLWHTILWIAQHVFHAKYGALGYIGMACAAAGVALLIFKAPFPRFVRWPLAFTYFMVYQYAVIARQYELLPLLLFAAAKLFKQKQHPERITLVLALLAITSFHGTLLAGIIGLAYLIEAFPSLNVLSPRVQARYWICGVAMVITFVFVFIVLKPPADSLEMVMKKGVFGLPADVNDQGQDITSFIKMNAIISGAFLDYWIPSVAFLVVAAYWCRLRRRLVLFLASVGSIVALYSLVYGTVHHQGIAFLAAIAILWIAWPSAGEQLAFRPRDRLALRSMIATMLCLCAINIWDSVVVIYRDYRYPYSGAENAANYLKAVAAERGTIFGYGFGISGLQAYFDHNILANIPTSYTHNGLPGWGLRADDEQLLRVNPEYLVVFTADPQFTLNSVGPPWSALGYEMIHFSDGYYLYKRAVFEREAYLIFRRVRTSVSQVPLPPRLGN